MHTPAAQALLQPRPTGLDTPTAHSFLPVCSQEWRSVELLGTSPAGCLFSPGSSPGPSLVPPVWTSSGRSGGRTVGHTGAARGLCASLAGRTPGTSQRLPAWPPPRSLPRARLWRRRSPGAGEGRWQPEQVPPDLALGTVVLSYGPFCPALRDLDPRDEQSVLGDGGHMGVHGPCHAWGRAWGGDRQSFPGPDRRLVVLILAFVCPRLGPRTQVHLSYRLAGLPFLSKGWMSKLTAHHSHYSGVRSGSLGAPMGLRDAAWWRWARIGSMGCEEWEGIWAGCAGFQSQTNDPMCLLGGVLRKPMLLVPAFSLTRWETAEPFCILNTHVPRGSLAISQRLPPKESMGRSWEGLG